MFSKYILKSNQLKKTEFARVRKFALIYMCLGQVLKNLHQIIRIARAKENGLKRAGAKIRFDVVFHVEEIS